MGELKDMEETLGPHFSDYIVEIKRAWNRSDIKKTAVSVRDAMDRLLNHSPQTEPWAVKLLEQKIRRCELYRDPDTGFIQMGHYHPANHASPPHDHGKHWVVYGVYRGEIEIRTYRLDDFTGKLQVLNIHTLAPGSAYAYFPGEIHSTWETRTEGSVVLRFLSADLKKVKRAHFDWDDIEIQE